MKPEAAGGFYVVNDKLETVANIEIFKKIKNPSIYEVLRIINGIPLFLEEHLDRMRKSANTIDYNIEWTSKEIEENIKKLILKNEIENQNIKLLCTDVEGIGQVFLIYFIKSFYPPKEYYKEGIHTILFSHERDNPNAKILKGNFREEVAKQLKKKEAFEAMLVTEEGYILEGSRSNMFFVKGEKIYTASNKDVLLGITRKHVFEAANKLNIKIIEENIHIDDLIKIDGAFMSGTSVNVLPISTIDNIKLDSVNNKTIKAVNNGYVKTMENYIKSKKKYN